jgi:hypothetical protein
MKNRQPVQSKKDIIIERLRKLPEVSPPAGLRSGIMASLCPKKPRLWTRVNRFLFQPRTVTFVPIKWAPVLAGLLMLAVIPRFAPLDSPQELVAESVPVNQATLTFTFEHPDAQQVALIGTFNGWTPDGRVRMEKQGNLWIFHVNVDPGRYEYAFLVDGREVVPDPRAVFHRNNGFGTPNSIVYATANGQNNI